MGGRGRGGGEVYKVYSIFNSTKDWMLKKILFLYISLNCFVVETVNSARMT